MSGRMLCQDFGFLKQGARIRPSFQKNLPTHYSQEEKDQGGRYPLMRFLLPRAKGQLVSERQTSLLPWQHEPINIQGRLNIFEVHRAEFNELARKFVVDLIVNLLA